MKDQIITERFIQLPIGMDFTEPGQAKLKSAFKGLHQDIVVQMSAKQLRQFAGIRKQAD